MTTISTTIKPGTRVTWRSEGERRPFVFFTGRVLDVPTTGPWVGTALVDDGSGMNPRAVKTKRLSVLPPTAPMRFAGRA